MQRRSESINSINDIRKGALLVVLCKQAMHAGPVLFFRIR